MKTSALLFATAPSADGGPAAALPAGDLTLLGRLLTQLESLDVERVWVVARPESRATVAAAAAAASAEVTVVASEDVSEDLRTAADVASRVSGPLVLGNAHVLTHREALAGLLADPRIASGVLATRSRTRGLWSFLMRSTRGRVVSPASPYHGVQWGNEYFLEFVKVDRRDLRRLAAAAEQLSELAAEPRPERWEEEFDRKDAEWRVRLWRAAVERETGVLPDPADAPDPASLAFEEDVEAELARRLRVLREDVVVLLLVGLVRAGAHVSPSSLRGFFYATPLSAGAVRLALEEMSTYDEDRVALDSAVKARDGFFTTFFVSPYSKYLARFAARRGWSPNAMTTLSFVIGVAAAASFAAGSRLALVAGAILLQIAFTVDCVDGQLARYTRTFSKLGAWLDSVFDRGKEYVVYAGLAVGASRGFGDDVWALAAAALTLQTVRHMIDFSYAARQHQAIASTPHLPLDQPEDVPLAIDLRSRGSAAAFALDVEAAQGGAAVVTQTRAPVLARRSGAAEGKRKRRPRRLTLAILGRYALAANRALERRSWSRWGKRILVLPIGERFALISLTAALATPRVTFVALLAWGGVAAAYAIAARTLASLAQQ